MARQKKNGQYLNVKIDMNVYKRLEEFCEETGYTKTAAVERALTTLMNNHEADQPRSRPGDSSENCGRVSKTRRDRG